MGLVGFLVASLAMANGGGESSGTRVQSPLPYFACLSRDPRLLGLVGKAKSGTELDEVAQSQGLVRVSEGGQVILLDPKLVKTPSEAGIRMLLTRIESGNPAVIDCASLSSTERQGIDSLILNSTLGPSLAREFAVRPDLRIAAQPWMVATLRNGEKSIRLGLNVGSIDDPKSFVTKSISDKVGMGFESKAASSLAKRMAPEAIQCQFNPLMSRTERSRLMIQASNALAEQIQQDERSRDGLLRSVLAPDGRSWDLTTPMPVSSLSAELRTKLEKSFVSQAANYGLSEGEQARTWFREATIESADVDIMVWIATNRSTGVLMRGFLVGNCRE